MGDPGKAVPIAPGNYDRAWNDPPLFSYNEGSGQAKQPHKLNRRAAYPMTSSGPSPPNNQNIPPLASGMPPNTDQMGAKSPPLGGMPLPPPASATSPPQDFTAQPLNDDTSLSLDQIYAKLQALIDENSSDKSADLTKRLDMMKKSVSVESQVTKTILSILSQYVQLIERKDLVTAERKLTSLGADYPGECATWIICLRHLLAAQKAKNQTDAPATQQSENTTPFFMTPLQP